MPLRYILLIISFGTVLALTGVGAILILVSPAELAWWGILVFYALCFLVMLGALTVAGTLLRVRRSKTDLPVRQLTRSFRQGAFLGLLGVVALVLSHLSLLGTWSLLLLVFGIACVELFFLTSRSRAS